ncbi:SGNH/GDSL hydrolase family protein [Clostridium sp.]|uniref:SGNH/GDSL hydrolase family protein n=1 Tax=Clostridium sp. TaxID=1506 RepID=UPI0039950A4C
MANNDYITTDCKLTVSKNTAKLDEEIFLYKNDRNIKLLIEIVDNKYRYKSDDLSNLLVKYKASYAQVKWYKNAEVKKEFPIQATDDGKVVFVIEGQLIDEDTELGDYDLQLRLLNESQESIRSLPIIKGAVHILKPLFEEGDIATVNSAIADVSMLSLGGDAIDTYNSDGTYNQTNWGSGDIISSSKLNKLEKVAKDNVDKVNKMPAKSIVEGGKIYLAKEDGTKLDSGTELPAGGTGTSYDDTEIKTDINTIKTDLGTEELTTTAKNVKGAVNEVAAQYKDIVNLSLTKHTDGKVYIKKQDGTLIGDGIEISGSDVDLSKITMSMSGQTLKLMNGGTQVATVEIPTATVTDEQLTSIIQSKIDDGTLTNMTIVDDSITPQKTDFLSYKDVCVSLTLEDDNSHGYIAKGGKMTNLIDITNATHIYVYCKDCSIIWFSYFVNNNETVKKPLGDLEDWFRDKLSKNISENINEFECDLSEFKSLGATSVKFGFTPADSVDVEKIKISLSTNDISLMEQQDKILNISEKYKKYWNNKIDVDDINLRIKQTPLVDIYKTINTGYSGTLQSQYGSNCNLCYGKDNGYVDVSTNKIIYFKTWCKSAAENNPFFGCYDSDKNFLYLSGADNSNVNQTLISSLGLKIENQSAQPWGQDKNGVNIYNKQIWKTVFPDEVKYVIPYTITGGFYHYMALFSYDMLNDFDVLADDYYNNYDENFEKYIKDIAGGKQKTTPKTMVCIGDSLTNWGGGTDGTNGFLKVVHDKTEIMTTNRGLAGAWWQTGDRQTQCAVNRVDYIIANNEKFDLYCFIMGSNAGSTTDTGETSSNKTTMCGAIRYCMETLKAYDPTAQILVCLPPQRAEGNANQLLVNEVIKKIVENEYSVRTLDLYKHSGVVPNTTIADVNYLSDGLHLGDNGQTAIGNVLASEVKYMLCL